MYNLILWNNFLIKKIFNFLKLSKFEKKLPGDTHDRSRDPKYKWQATILSDASKSSVTSVTALVGVGHLDRRHSKVEHRSNLSVGKTDGQDLNLIAYNL